MTLGYRSAVRQASLGQRHAYFHDMANAFQSLSDGNDAEVFNYLLKHDYAEKPKDDYRD